MSVLPFRVREPDPFARYYLKTVLVKDAETRLYQILPGGETGAVQTWVRFNGQPHRAQLCKSIVCVERIRREYDREIAALLADGWTVQA